MTGAQRSYLKTLSEEAHESFDDTLTKAEASRRIEELQARTGRGTSGDRAGARQQDDGPLESLGRAVGDSVLGAEPTDVTAERLERAVASDSRDGASGTEPRTTYSPGIGVNRASTPPADRARPAPGPARASGTQPNPSAAPADAAPERDLGGIPRTLDSGPASSGLGHDSAEADISSDAQPAVRQSGRSDERPR